MTLYAAAFLVIEVLGVLSAVRAIMETRTAQGAIAWALALVALPIVAVPAYWIFGRSRFRGFVELRRADLLETEAAAKTYLAKLRARDLVFRPDRTEPLAIERLGRLPFTAGNEVELLIDGAATFDSIVAGIERAREYVLVQFYILRADDLGRRLQRAMIDRARAGVRCYMLFDEVGSLGLSRSYVRELEASGVHIRPFNTRKGRTNRFQVNFRNHRKIVVVDGKEAWVGGLNVGDEYLGLDPEIGYWRDTHMRVAGPAAQSVQVSFVEDWNWAASEILELEWSPQPAARDARAGVMVLPTGPADQLESATLLFLGAISLATERLWIATPYFVPDEQFVSALQLAALRGVDVRLIVPKKLDNPMVGMSHWSYLEELEKVGIQVFRHTKGFMHQKVVLVDRQAATVGTANFDNRSFRLNFEITLAVADEQFNAEIAAMLEQDLADSEPMTAAELESKGFWFRFLVRLARLAAPVQ